MGGGKDLSPAEKVEIDTCFSLGLNQSEIAQRLGRSRHAIQNQLNKPENYERAKRGAKRKLSERDIRHIGRQASNKMTSSARIKDDLELDVSTRTVRRALAMNPDLSYDKKRKGPTSTVQSKRARLDWGNDHCNMVDAWKLVIFSDEKKFNLDGPDGLQMYWHDHRKGKLRFAKRHSGGGGVMFWGGIGAHGLTPLVLIEERMDSDMYQRVIRDYLLPNTHDICGDHFTFQQDGAPCHRSNSTRAFMQRRNVTLLDWPAYSPDMNIIENLWGYLTQVVYKDGKQYRSKRLLEDACRDAWDEIDQDYIDSLFNSLPNRIRELIDANGGPTSY
jgi:transposase